MLLLNIYRCEFGLHLSAYKRLQFVLSILIFILRCTVYLVDFRNVIATMWIHFPKLMQCSAWGASPLFSLFPSKGGFICGDYALSSVDHEKLLLLDAWTSIKLLLEAFPAVNVVLLQRCHRCCPFSQMLWKSRFEHKTHCLI